MNYFTLTLTNANFSSDKLIKMAQSYICASSKATKKQSINRIVISVCSGRSETEVQTSPEDLCVCLDMVKRSLFAAAFSHKYLQQHKSNLTFQQFDMGNGLQDFFSRLTVKSSVPILVLFQHPSNAIGVAVRDCMILMQSGLISSVHFVFDYHRSKNSWTDQPLKEVCLSKCPVDVRNAVHFTETVCISELKETLVLHPLFGDIDIGGWAKMKVGKERCFSLIPKLI